MPDVSLALLLDEINENHKTVFLRFSDRLVDSKNLQNRLDGEEACQTAYAGVIVDISKEKILIREHDVRRVEYINDSERSYKLTRYILTRIGFAVGDGCKNKYGRKDHPRPSESSITDPESHGQVESQNEIVDNHDFFQTRFSRLTPLQQQLLREKYFEGKSYKQIAKEHGMTEREVKTVIQDAIDGMRD